MEDSRDIWNIAYIVHFLLGAGNLVPWNSFVTAIDYFEYLYPNKHVDKVFSVAYMISSLLVLVTLMCLSTFNKLPGFKSRMNASQILFMVVLMVAPVSDWVCGGEARKLGYVVMVVSLVVCGVASGLNEGSLVGATGQLPGRYMQAIFAGNASSGILICILRIVTKVSLPHTPKGLRISTKIYFILSTLIILVCMIFTNVLHKLPVIQHYQQKQIDAQKVDQPTQRAPIWQVLKKIRWAAFSMLVTYIVTLSIFPGYLSENVESKSLKDWYPILLLTTYNLGDLLGKCLTAIYVPKSIERVIWGSMCRLLFYGCFTGCIHGPRWLRSEFVVVPLTWLLGISNGYVTSVLMMLAPKLVQVEESETVGIVMVLFLMTGLATGSIVSWVWNL